MMNLKSTLFLLSLIFSSFIASGAELVLKDGSRLNGELIKIHDGKVHYQTQFAGILIIDQALVSNISSDAEVFLKTSDGQVFKGAVAESDSGMLITSNRGSIQADVDEVVSAWPTGKRDPVIVSREQELESQVRKWTYEAGVDISSSDGNTDKFTSGIRAKAVLAGPNDELILEGSYKYAEQNGVRSEDEQMAAMRYTNYFTSKLGWFVRSSLERDKFELVEFRSTTAAGLSYRWIKEKDMSLETTAGLSYRYESYFPTVATPNPTSESFPGLDFGLKFRWNFAKWGVLNTNLGFLPSVDDFGDYLVDHETSVDIPLKVSDKWKLRIGISNQYNSSPDLGREELDTSYFMRLIMNWD